jgi:cell division septation protein DedD
LAQDDYYYEIQLTNKQLVFYFMAGATGLILSFLAGVMVGRGVDASASEVQASRPVQEERVVAEEPAKPAPPSTDDLTYAQRLEAEKTEDVLEKPKPLASVAAPKVTPVKPAASKAGPPSPAAVASAGPMRVVPSAAPPAKPPAAKPSPVAPPAAAARGGNFTIQVGAFKDRASADRVVARLKSKGFPASVAPAEGGGLFNVRVGSYEARADAERVQVRLRDEEKFKPFIVKK